MILKSRYPDGSVWWIIHFTELSGGKISKSTVYFAPMFDPPQWRANGSSVARDPAHAPRLIVGENVNGR